MRQSARISPPPGASEQLAAGDVLVLHAAAARMAALTEAKIK